MDAPALLALLRCPASPLRPEHLLFVGTETTAPAIRPPARAAAPPSPSLERRLLHAIGEDEASSPTSLLAERCAELLGATGDVDPRMALADAHAALARGRSAAQAQEELRTFCTANLLRGPPELLAEHERWCEVHARPGPEGRRALLRRLDLQVQLRLALASTEGSTDALGRKAYKELKKTLQLYGIKLAAVAAAAAAAEAEQQKQKQKELEQQQQQQGGAGDEPVRAPSSGDAEGDELKPPSCEGAAVASAAGSSSSFALVVTESLVALPWRSIDEYIMRRLRPRYRAALPQTIARLVADFHEEGLEPAPDPQPHEEAAARPQPAAPPQQIATGGGLLALEDEAPSGGAEATGTAEPSAAGAGDLSNALLAVAPAQPLEASCSGAGGVAAASAVPSAEGGGSVRSSAAGAAVPASAAAAAAAERLLPSARAASSLKRGLSLDEAGGSRPAFKVPVPLVRSNSEAVSTTRVGSHAQLKTHADLKLELARQSSRQLVKPKTAAEKQRAAGKQRQEPSRGADGAIVVRREKSSKDKEGSRKRKASGSGGSGDAGAGGGEAGGSAARRKKSRSTSGGEERRSKNGKRPLGERHGWNHAPADGKSKPKATHKPRHACRRTADGDSSAGRPAVGGAGGAGSSTALVSVEESPTAQLAIDVALRNGYYMPHHRLPPPVYGSGSAGPFVAATPASTPAPHQRHVGGNGGVISFNVADTPLNVLDTPGYSSLHSSLSSGQYPISGPHAVAHARAAQHAIVIAESPQAAASASAIVVAESPVVLRRNAQRLSAGAQLAMIGGPPRSRHVETPPMLIGYRGGGSVPGTGSERSEC